MLPKKSHDHEVKSQYRGSGKPTSNHRYIYIYISVLQQVKLTSINYLILFYLSTKSKEDKKPLGSNCNCNQDDGTDIKTF